jgi:Dolichyl-phosphate-mannose-protein mannosyltransferase
MRADVAAPNSIPVVAPARLGAVFGSRVADYIAAAALGSVVVATRIPLAGRYLFDWDSLQFALGMQHFNLAAHRPHPPGYVGYIFLGKILAGIFGGDANLGLVTLSVSAEAFSVVAVFLVARRLLGQFAGLAAGILMLTSPLVWLYGETALTYGLEPGLSLIGFWLVYRSAQAGGRGLVAASLVIGLAGAIRPSAEFFLLPLLSAGMGLILWNARRRSPLKSRQVVDLVVLPGTALVVGTCLWLVPLVYLSGGPASYLYVSGQLAARVSSSSAVWRAGLGGLALNSQAVLAGLALSLGVYLVLAAGLLAIALVPGTGVGGTRPPRSLALLGVAWILPAGATFLLVHIGQLAYVLYLVPALLLPAGVVLERVARVVTGPWPRWHGWAKWGLLLACAGGNVATFALPEGSLLSQLQARDRHVEALVGLVHRYPPSQTVLLADPEGPSSYRTAMFYLPEYRVVALGRDRRGRAGELFSNRPGAPEYDLARFEQTGPLHLPSTGTALVLDEALLASIGDPGRLRTVTTDDPLARHIFVVQLDPTDPVVAGRSWIYLRGSDDYQFRRPWAHCADPSTWSCPASPRPRAPNPAGS